MVKYGLEYELKDAVFPIPGIALALFTYAMLVALGLSRVLTKYPASYNCIRFAGACYLIYLGSSGFYKLYKNTAKPRTALDSSLGAKRPRMKLFASGYICALTNPKILVIYLAFLPQFIDHTRKVLPQFFLLGLTHILIVMSSMTTYCVLANKTQNYIKKYAKYQTAFSNLILISLGVFLILEKHLVS